MTKIEFRQKRNQRLNFLGWKCADLLNLQSETCDTKLTGRYWGVSVHHYLQEFKTDGYVFWDQNVCIVSDADSPISLTGIDKIKHLSIIYIHIRIILLIFIIHQANRLWFKVEVIHAIS
jgi:hypothetical protein